MLAGLLLFNANVRREHASTPLHRDPICAKLSMIEWQIENSTFSVPPFRRVLAFFQSRDRLSVILFSSAPGRYFEYTSICSLDRIFCGDL